MVAGLIGTRDYNPKLWIRAIFMVILLQIKSTKLLVAVLTMGICVAQHKSVREIIDCTDLPHETFRNLRRRHDCTYRVRS